MKRKLSIWLSCLVVVLAGLCIGLPIASAHTLTVDDLLFKGVGPGMTLGEVKAVLGEPDKLDGFTGDGVRIVNYVYGKYAQPDMIVMGRTGALSESPEEEIKVSGLTINSVSIANKQGLRVGMYYRDVVEKYGEGQKLVQGKKTLYIYEITGTAQELALTMGPENTISQIRVSTEL